MIDEFKRFLFRGNIVDLAVAVILGTAFAAVVTAFTEGVISPLIGLVAGQSFDTLTITLKEPTIEDPAGVVLAYGAVITAMINFVLVAAVIFFLVVKPMQAIQARRASGEVTDDTPAPSDEAILLTEIRDLLAAPR